MKEEKLRRLPNNDLFAQFVNKKWAEEKDIRRTIYSKRRIEEIENCNHLFLKLKDKEYVGTNHSSDTGDELSTLECVHCGLTNKFEFLENKLQDIDTLYTNPTIETKLFHKTYKDAYIRCSKSFNENVFNLISDEVIPTNQAGLLYKLALIINPIGTNEELFSIMNTLNELETNLEKWKLRTIDQCADLLNRYDERKCLIK